MRAFVPGKRQYIGQLELIYAVAPYYTLPELFRGRDVIHFIDNTSACWALVKGYSKAIDCGLIVNAFHACNLGLQARVFFEYVNTKATPAALPSRGATEELLDELRRAGIGDNIQQVECILPHTRSWWSSAGRWVSEIKSKVRDAIRRAARSRKRERP